MRNATILLFLLASQYCTAQEIPIDNYFVNVWGQAELQIQAQADKYYLLSAKHEPNNDYETITSMTLGVDGTLSIIDALSAYPEENYSVTEHSIANPDDTDGDGIDDYTEYTNMPTNSPLNAAQAVQFEDGTTAIDSEETFSNLAVITDEVPWAPFLNNQEFVKFGILDINTDAPRVYFINSNTHFIHAEFFAAIGINVTEDGSGEIIFNPNDINSNGTLGSYSFSYSFGEAKSFENTQRTYELLAASMPFLRNNLKHFIGDAGESQHMNQYASDFEGSRIEVVFESEFFGDVDFIPFHQAEGYGFFKAMTLEETPGSRDVVLYDALPNSLPRVGGIITSVIQTPLSHVNLRAIQDDVPNAFIKDPLEKPAIAELLNGYVYYKVEEDGYEMREATLEEVNAWYEDLRPTEPQIPERDLSFTNILPLNDINFDMSSAFGAKCSNVATMRDFGLVEGTIPDGFGIPFYYYDEFMKFNDFYQRVEEMLADPVFQTDLEVRIETLKDFRKDIRSSTMPQWMLDDLQVMHDAFPEGTRVRCRSSTNNEDLPGFSGAGLYTSKTQHLDEGHISKSIKQVYASMWNFRAYEERDFFRVDHFIAAMGILCHPNFEDEESNGVGVSLDPIYDTQDTYFLNTQVGESLVTNPDVNSIPEELLLFEDPSAGYTVVRESNLVEPGELVMNEQYLNEMRENLSTIHEEFAILYDVVGAEGFGMDIEYKVTAQDQLVIKQARPWVSFWAEFKAAFDLEVVEVLSPQSAATLGDEELISINVANSGLEDMSNFELLLYIDDELKETSVISGTLLKFTDLDHQFSIPQNFSEKGDYKITVVVVHPDDGFSQNDTLESVISNLHALESGLDLLSSNVLCADEIAVNTSLTNFGESVIETAEIQVTVNGQLLESVQYDVTVPFQSSEELTILVSENLELENNEILVELLTVNGEVDAVNDNNQFLLETDLTSNSQSISLVLTPDNYPEESSWELINQATGEIESTGDFEDGDFIDEICALNGTCYTLKFYDEFGDGICCGFGEGSFNLVDSEGESLGFSNGEFNTSTEIEFCTSGESEEIVSGTTNLVVQDALKVYPNPVTNNLTIQFGDVFEAADNIDLKIYDSQGRMLTARSVKSNTEASLSFSGFPSGLYVIRCSNGTVESRVKVLKR